MAEVFGITGWKDSGKTTLITSLVSEFASRGVLVSTIKHAHHEFDIDHEGTDSFRHREAGAREVALVSSKRWAMIHENTSAGEEPSLETMISKMAPCDLILVEGFKSSPFQKIETISADRQTQSPIWKANDTIVGIAADKPQHDCPKPQFDLNDITSIAHFVVQMSGLKI